MSLLCLLAVTKKGKHSISIERVLADSINKFAQNDANGHWQEAAGECRLLVTELPLGKAIMGTKKSAET
jgi:hypothetical protein